MPRHVLRKVVASPHRNTIDSREGEGTALRETSTEVSATSDIEMTLDGRGARATVLGECVADIIRDSAGTELTYPGGSAANVAVGLARLGRRVAFYTCLGDDANGRLMRAHLESERVDFVNIAAAGTPTPSAVAVLNASGSASYTFSVEWVTQELVLQPRAPHLHLGSFAAFLADEPGDLDDRLHNLQGRCSISLDPNVRPDDGRSGRCAGTPRGAARLGRHH